MSLLPRIVSMWILTGNAVSVGRTKLQHKGILLILTITAIRWTISTIKSSNKHTPMIGFQ